ncbi:MAG: DUF805 domain-containing protein [Akkermansia sp.]
MNQSPPLTLVRAECEMFSRAFDYRGRSTGAAFWKTLLGCIMMSITWCLFAGIAGGALHHYFGWDKSVLPYWLAFEALGLLIIYVPFIALTTRRMRDAGFAPWHWLWIILPYYIGFLVILFICTRPTCRK